MEKVLSTLIPSLAAEKVFGGGDFLGLDTDDTGLVGPQFSSQIAFVNVKLRKTSGELIVVPLVVKVRSAHEDILDSRLKQAHVLFSNEVFMYKDVLPFLDREALGSYPKMYHGKASNNNVSREDVLILKNLKADGFQSSGRKVFLDFDHIAVAIRNLGKFHSLSYRLKFGFPEKLKEFTEKLAPTRGFFDDDEHKIYLCLKRGIDPIIKKGIETADLKKLLKAFEQFPKVMEFLHKPTEPFAVILHGDYCSNNILFKYNNDNIPIDCAYFDFQNSRYGNPVVDLAFFLYMHTTPDIRERHWNSFLRIYWTSVKDNLPSNIELPTFEEFLQHFSKTAVLGYYPCSFFLPMMVFPEKILPLDKYLSFSTQEKLEYNLYFGGDEGESIISEIVMHLVEQKYVSKFLEYYKNKCMSE